MLWDITSTDGSLNFLSSVLRGTFSSSPQNDRIYPPTANSPRQRTTSQTRSKTSRWVPGAGAGAADAADAANRRRYNALRKEMRPCSNRNSVPRDFFGQLIGVITMAAPAPTVYLAAFPSLCSWYLRKWGMPYNEWYSEYPLVPAMAKLRRIAIGAICARGMWLTTCFFRFFLATSSQS